MESKPNGIIDNIRRLVWVSRVAPIKAAPDLNSVSNEDEEDDENENPPRLGDLMALAEQEDEVVNYPNLSIPAEDAVSALPQTSTPTPLSRVTIPPGDLAKRKRPSERLGAYDVPVADDETEEGVKVQGKKGTKRSRHNLKAKQPIVAAKKSNGQRLPLPSRRAPEIQSSASAELEVAPARPPPTNTASNEDKVTASIEPVKAPSGKVKRGRPRKAQPLGQDNHEEEAVPSLADNSAPQSSTNTVPGDTEGLSSILMNPSPVKVARPATRVERPDH